MISLIPEIRLSEPALEESCDVHSLSKRLPLPFRCGGWNGSTFTIRGISPPGRIRSERDSFDDADDVDYAVGRSHAGLYVDRADHDVPDTLDDGTNHGSSADREHATRLLDGQLQLQPGARKRS